MFKYLLLLVFIGFSLFPAQYNYQLEMAFKRGPTPNDMRSHTVLNKKEVFCPCGKPPVFTMFFYGNPQHYCASHIPEIEYVRPITKDNLDDFLASLSKMENNGKK